MIYLILILCGFVATYEDNDLPPEAGQHYVDERTEVDTFKNILSKLGFFPGQAENDEDDKDIQCPICCDEYKDEDILRKMPCDHFFHKECIDIWMEKRSECPICQQDIRIATSKFAQKTDNIISPPVDSPPVEMKTITYDNDNIRVYAVNNATIHESQDADESNNTHNSDDYSDAAESNNTHNSDDSSESDSESEMESFTEQKDVTI